MQKQAEKRATTKKSISKNSIRKKTLLFRLVPTHLLTTCHNQKHHGNEETPTIDQQGAALRTNRVVPYRACVLRFRPRHQRLGIGRGAGVRAHLGVRPRWTCRPGVIGRERRE